MLAFCSEAMVMFTSYGAVRMLALLAALIAGGCGEAFVNLTASLGGEVAGSRGSVDVVAINNTPHPAAFILGTFDPGNPDFPVDATQFGLDEIGLKLGPDSQSDAISFRCGRVFSVGGRRLLDLVEAAFDAEDIEDAAFAEGVSFYQADPEEAESEPVFFGSATALEALLGLDFNCGSILVLRLEVNELAPAAFRVDFEVIPSASGR